MCWTRYLQCWLSFLLTWIAIECAAQVSATEAQDLVRRVDRNYQSVPCGEIVYSVETSPGEVVEELKRGGTAASPFENAVANALAQKQKVTIRLLFNKDMYRYEYNDYIADSHHTTRKQLFVGYDGRRYWRYDPSVSEGSLLGEDVRGEDPRIPYLIYELGYPLSRRILDAPPHTKASVLTLHGKQTPVYLLSLPGQGYTERLCFDPSKGYMLVRSDIFSSNRSKVTREVVEAKEIKAGVWFPIKTRTRMYDDKGRVIFTTTIEVHSVKTDLDVTSDMFKPDFPVGTRVSDLINNRVYIVTSSVWTFRRTLLALAILAMLFGFWWWRYHLADKRRAVQ